MSRATESCFSDAKGQIQNNFQNYSLHNLLINSYSEQNYFSLTLVFGIENILTEAFI